MNNEEAKFFLHACRPSRQDSTDPTLAPALEQARQDPALARWFAREQAFGAAVSEKLNSISPPSALRDAILAGARATQAARQPARRWRQPAWLASAAAFLIIATVAAWWAFAPVPGDTLDEFALNFVERRFLLQKRSVDVSELRTWLASQGGPLPSRLPAAFSDLRALGCRTIDFQGREISLVCFERDGREFHVFIARRDDLPAPVVPSFPLVERRGHALASWSDERNHYVLVSDAPAETVEQLL